MISTISNGIPFSVLTEFIYSILLILTLCQSILLLGMGQILRHKFMINIMCIVLLDFVILFTGLANDTSTNSSTKIEQWQEII